MPNTLHMLPYFILTTLKNEVLSFLVINKETKDKTICLSESHMTSGRIGIPSQGLSVNH